MKPLAVFHRTDVDFHLLWEKDDRYLIIRKMIENFSPEELLELHLSALGPNRKWSLANLCYNDTEQVHQSSSARCVLVKYTP